MSIVRTQHDKNNPYVTLNKGALEDPNLSWAAKGLWAYLLGRPDNWHVSVAHLSKIYNGRGGGEKAIYVLLNELIDNGYCERKQKQAKTGQWQSTEYIVHELKECLPHPLERDAVDRVAVKGDTTNKGVITNNEKTTTAAPPSEPVVVPFPLINLKISEELKQNLLKKYDMETLIEAVRYTLSKKPKNFEGYLICACEKKWALTDISRIDIDENKKFAEKCLEKAEIPKGIMFEVLSKTVEIGNTIGSKFDVIEYDMNCIVFKERLEKCIKEYKIKIKT